MRSSKLQVVSVACCSFSHKLSGASSQLEGLSYNVSVTSCCEISSNVVSYKFSVATSTVSSTFSCYQFSVTSSQFTSYQIQVLRYEFSFTDSQLPVFSYILQVLSVERSPLQVAATSFSSRCHYKFSVTSFHLQVHIYKFTVTSF